MHHKLMHTHGNNTPSIAWLTKMATKTADSDAAHRLVRELALYQQIMHSAPVSITHAADSDNNLADIALLAITQLDDNHAFFTHFDNLLPLLERFWQQAIPPPTQLLCNGGHCHLSHQLALVTAILYHLWNGSMTARHNSRNPQPAILGICRPDSYWILWERLASWSPEC